ncbi:MAG: acyltransferase [Gemmatimonadota bacterium]
MSDAPAKRFEFIDGLRGIAATMVAIYHLHPNLDPAISAWFSRTLSDLIHWGLLGVEIFFVISGFVIAHSVRHGLHTFGYLGRFALRRSIRLDPALWATIALEMLAIQAGLMLMPSAVDAPMPEWPQVLANAVYLQHFLGLGDVVQVFWTLTYEIQFYIVLVTSLVLWHTLPFLRTVLRGKTWLVPLMALYAYSLLIFIGVFETPLRGLFIDRWFQFSLGILVWLRFREVISTQLLAGVIVLTTIVALFGAPNTFRTMSIMAAVVTGTVLAYAAITDRFSDWLADPVSQFFGRISYSLYLIHAVIGWRVISLLKALLGPELGPGLAFVTFMAGMVTSVISAWVMFKIIEAPTMSFARRVRLPTRGS